MADSGKKRSQRLRIRAFRVVCMRWIFLQRRYDHALLVVTLGVGLPPIRFGNLNVDLARLGPVPIRRVRFRPVRSRATVIVDSRVGRREAPFVVGVVGLIQWISGAAAIRAPVSEANKELKGTSL